MVSLLTGRHTGEILAHPDYKKGKTVELGSCNTGKGTAPYAQKLADELTKQSCKKTKVRAPTGFAWFYKSGKVVSADRKADKSIGKKKKWKTFKGKKK